jgi:hypothetical protein
MKGMMGSQDAAMLEEMQGMDPESLAREMGGKLPPGMKFNPNEILGANPFLKGKK